MKRRFSALCAALCFVLLAASQAAASGFSTLGFAPDYATAVTTSPFAVFSNPAAMMNGQGLRLFVDGALALRHAAYERVASDSQEPPGADGANTGRATLFNVFGLPTLSATARLGKYASIGLGASVPFGGAAKWDKVARWKNDVDYPGAVDSPARWHAIEGQWITGFVSAAGAVQIPNTRLSFGLTGNFVYSQLSLTQAATTSLSDEILAEGRMSTKLTGMTGSFGLGVQYEALPERVWFGLSYQAPPGFWQGMHMVGPLWTNFGNGPERQTINLRQDYPDILQLGMRVRPRRFWEVRMTGNYMRWSVMKSQCLALGRNRECKVSDSGLVPQDSKAFANFVRRWHDSFGARISNSFFFGERYEAFFALSFDGTAVPDATLEPGLLDGNDVGLTLGSNIQLTDDLLLGFSYMHQAMIARDTTGLSRLADHNGRNHLPSANGRYEQWVGIANLNLTARFGAR